jgi:hypothetical protein
LMTLALGGVLAGCTANPGDHPVTIQVMTAPSKWTAEFTVAQAGTYSYNLTYSPHCVPLPGFIFISPEGVERFARRGPNLYAASTQPIPVPVHVAGSLRLSAGRWKGVSGDGDPTGPQASYPPPSARLPVGGYWAAGCSWSLTLTSSS